MTSEGVLAETEFDRGIAATRRPDEPTTYDVELGAGWQIGAGINGGMLLATLGNALRTTLEADGHRDPLTISAYYLSASRPGPALVQTEVLRSGRNLSTATASLVQVEDGQRTERLRALATYGDLAALPDEVHTTATPPDLPPPDQCISTDAAPPTFMKNADLLDRLDLRLDPACAGWALGGPSGRGLIQGWLRVTHSTRNFAGGMLEEDAEVWDASGRLVAQSRQLARAPKPR